MKKILCGILCASAGAVLAVESTVTTIDVIEVRSDLTNVVVAIPGLDLAGGNLAISNLVKTTNLSVNDKLIAFDSGVYQCWSLSSAGKWEPFIDAVQDGNGVSFGPGTPAADKTMFVGQGIWLLRTNPLDEFGNVKPFYVYAQHVDSPTTTVTAGTVALVGNPTTVADCPTITNPAVNDVIAVPRKIGASMKYQYTGSKWYYHGVEYDDPPSIQAGTGFWYISKGGTTVTITW